MVLARLTTCLLAVAALAMLPVGGASSALLVVGGRPIAIEAAPWTVFVEERTHSQLSLCTGAVIDATHVLTAAHCVFDSSGSRAQPSALSVRAGVSDPVARQTRGHEQQRSVNAIRVHPGYVWTGRPEPDDVAVLALSRPLDLSGPTVQAVVLPAPGSAFPGGAPVALAGFGRRAHGRSNSGSLAWMTATIDPQGECGPTGAGLIGDNAVRLCASSPTSAVCSGDSGAGLVTLGRAPTLVGILSGSPATCRIGTQSLYTYTGAPEIRAFVEGSNSPPTAPREEAGHHASLGWRPPLVPGTTLTCRSGRWLGRPRLRYAFLSSRTGKVLQAGPRPTLVVPSTIAGSEIFCEVAATNAGGTTLAKTGPAEIADVHA